MLVIWTHIITGSYLISLGLITKTNNFGSSLVFKVIPFFLGLGNLILGLKGLEIIK